MSGIMPPEPPPPASESDYLNGGGNKRQQVSTVVGSQDVGVFGLDLPIPQHLINRVATPALNQAVSEVLADSDESIPKRGYNKFHQYWYATADDIRLHVAAKLGAHGLSYEQHEIGYTPFGSLIAVHYYFVLVHKSGETAPPQRVTVLTQMISNKGAPDDKAFSKATVLALKDWSKGKFSIPTGDVLEDPDADDRPPPPIPTQQPTQHKPAAKLQPSAGNAFANRGTTKIEKPVQATDNPTDVWLEGALTALNDEQDTGKWMVLLRKIVPSCTTITQLMTIERDVSVIKAMAEAPPRVRDEIEMLFKTASIGLAPSIKDEAPVEADQHV